MKRPKDEPVVVGGVATVGVVSILLGVSDLLGLELGQQQLAGAVAVVVAIVTWFQRRNARPL